MRKIFAALTLLACFFGPQAWATFNGPALPMPIPFKSGTKTYEAYVQTYHPHYGQSRICYYPNDVSYEPVISKSGVIYGGLVNVVAILNPASFNQAWDSSSYYSTDLLCAYHNGSGWVGGTGLSGLGTPNQRIYTTYGWNDWYFNGSYNYDHDLTHNIRAEGVNLKVNETYNYNGQFHLGSVSANATVITGITTPATPSSILSPVVGALETVTSDVNCSGLVWCFNQHNTGAHTSSGGVGSSNDTYAWDANLNYPNANTDNGMAVYAVAPGVVAATYAGQTNAGGTTGHVLVQHSHNGNKWWSAYLHLGSIAVSVGDNVTSSSQLGVVSSTGTGNAHLHFVVYTGSNTSGGLVSFNTTITQR